jgi:hypothetical protein
MHGIMFFVSFALIGFTTFLMNFILTCWSYSCALTLRERATLFYFILLATGFIIALCSVCIDELGGIQLFGKISICVIYLILGFVVGKHYYAFRKSGGLYGDNKSKTTQPLIEKDEKKQEV